MQLQNIRPGIWLILILIVLVTGAIYFSPKQLYLFKDVQGPKEHTTIPAAQVANWQAYQQGGTGRLAVLLTDTDSAWLGLARGLQSIGVPFLITRDYREAIRHRVVFVYTTI